MEDLHIDNPPKTDDDPSKSQRKRDMLALQSLGKQLVDLADGTLKKLELPESLAEAIAEARKLKSREARRRHLQLIGKLMRTVDVAALTLALERMDHQSPANQRHLQKLEDWRDRLIDGDGALIEDIIEQHPSADRQQLRNLQRRAVREDSPEKISAARRKLFAYLRQL
jgi:ribosome-associated protein